MGLLTLLMLVVQPSSLIAEDRVLNDVPVKEYTKAELLDKVYYYAQQYNVNPKTMVSVMNCENKEWDTNLQSRIINKKGIREDSWGLVQIHKPSHPTLTHEQITNPDFSINFLAENLSKGKGNMWTCYKMLTK